MRDPLSATILGFISLLFWSFGAVFTKYLHDIPTFEILTVVFSLSFMMGLTKVAYEGAWQKLRQPLFIWLVGIIGLFGNDMLYILAFKHAPAAHVDLINYLWPLLVVFFTFLLPGERWSIKYVFAAMIGFLGVFLLIITDAQEVGFKSDYLLGYLFAFLDAVAWALYMLVMRYYGKTPIEMIAMFSGFGAIFAFFAHMHFEPTIIPSQSQLLVLFIMGFTTQGLAYYFWAHSVNHGNFQLLSVMSYLVPVVSVLLLVAFHMAALSNTLIFASLMVSLSGLVCALDETGKLFREKSKSVKNIVSFNSSHLN